MIKSKTLQVGVAIVVFFALQLLFFGTADGRLMAAVWTTLVFAMVYAAFIAGFEIFRSDKKDNS